MPRRPGRDVGSLLASAIAFGVWAGTRPMPPTTQQVQEYLRCSRTKALTWHRHLLNSLPPREHPSPAATGTTCNERTTQ